MSDNKLIEGMEGVNVEDFTEVSFILHLHFISINY